MKPLITVGYMIVVVVIPSFVVWRSMRVSRSSIDAWAAVVGGWIGLAISQLGAIRFAVIGGGTSGWVMFAMSSAAGVAAAFTFGWFRALAIHQRATAFNATLLVLGWLVFMNPFVEQAASCFLGQSMYLETIVKTTLCPPT